MLLDISHEKCDYCHTYRGALKLEGVGGGGDLIFNLINCLGCKFEKCPCCMSLRLQMPMSPCNFSGPGLFLSVLYGKCSQYLFQAI